MTLIFSSAVSGFLKKKLYLISKINGKWSYGYWTAEKRKARTEIPDMQRTVSHTYEIHLSRRRYTHLNLWNTGTWSPKSSRPVVIRLMVQPCRLQTCWSTSMKTAVAALCNRTLALPTSTTPHGLLIDSTARLPIKKKQRPLPCSLPPPGIAVTRTTNTTFYSRNLERNHHIPLNPNNSLQKALDIKGTLG